MNLPRGLLLRGGIVIGGEVFPAKARLGDIKTIRIFEVFDAGIMNG